MRAFILSCLLATALAIPQGYNYPAQQQQLSNSISFTPQLPIHSAFQGSQQQYSTQTHHNSIPQSFLPQNFGPLQQSFGSAPQTQTHQQVYQPQPQLQPQYQQNVNPSGSSLVTKDIFVHVAPEEPENRYVQQQSLPVAPPRKHYRIVFIKAPTHKITSNALRVQQAPVEEKTIIYVLTKKPDPLELKTALQEVAHKPPSKPEVYFIKYKTQEEAQHAQRTIQEQYDKLGGTTQVSDEGVAPIASVIGSLDQSQAVSGNSGSLVDSNNLGVSASYGAPVSNGVSNSITSNESKYLPPIRT